MEQFTKNAHSIISKHIRSINQRTEDKGSVPRIFYSLEIILPLLFYVVEKGITQSQFPYNTTAARSAAYSGVKIPSSEAFIAISMIGMLILWFIPTVFSIIWL